MHSCSFRLAPLCFPLSLAHVPWLWHLQHASVSTMTQASPSCSGLSGHHFRASDAATHRLLSVTSWNYSVSLLTSRTLGFCMPAKPAPSAWLCQDLLPSGDLVRSLLPHICVSSAESEKTLLRAGAFEQHTSLVCTFAVQFLSVQVNLYFPQVRIYSKGRLLPSRDLPYCFSVEQEASL